MPPGGNPPPPVEMSFHFPLPNPESQPPDSRRPPRRSGFRGVLISSNRVWEPGVAAPVMTSLHSNRCLLMRPGPFTHKRGGKETAATQTETNPVNFPVQNQRGKYSNHPKWAGEVGARGAPPPLRALNLRLDVISPITERQGLDDGSELNSVSARQHFQPQGANWRCAGLEANLVSCPRLDVRQRTAAPESSAAWVFSPKANSMHPHPGRVA